MKVFRKDGKLYILDASLGEVELTKSVMRERKLKSISNEQLIIGLAKAVTSNSGMYFGSIPVMDIANEILRRMK